MHLISLLSLAITVSIDSLLYGMIYEKEQVKIMPLTLIVASLAGWALIATIGLISKLLVWIFPLILAKIIGVILLMIFSLIILRDLITCRQKLFKVSCNEGNYLYQSRKKISRFSLKKLIYMPSFSDDKIKLNYLEGVSLGVMMNMDGAVVTLALGMIEGEILITSLTFTLIGVILFKLGQLLVKNNLIK